MSGRHGASAPPWGKVIFTLLATYAIAWLSPLGHGDAIDRYGKQFFNRLVASLSYGHSGEGARAATQVVLISDRDLQQLRWVWPATYGDHAGILDELRALRPGALMIDIAFVDPRPDPTLPELIAALTAYAKDGIPVFLASVPLRSDDPGIRPELANWSEAPVPRPLLVSVPPLVGANGYPLFDAEGRESAALAVYRAICDAREPRHICATPLAEFPAPAARDRAAREAPVVELFWGTRPDPQSFRQECRDAHPATWARFLGRVGVEWWTRGVLESCPFTPTLAAARVLLDERGAFRRRIEGRAVFYGASLVGSADVVDSPVHGKIPGVYAHAMALDNLMTFGADYKRESAEVIIAPGLLSAGLAALSLAALLNVRNPRMRSGLPASDHAVLCLAGLALAAALAVRVATPEMSRSFMHFQVTPETVQLAAVVPTVQGFLLWFLLRAEQSVVRRLEARGARRWELVLVRVGSILGYLGVAIVAILLFAGLVEFAWLDLMPGHWTASILELAIGRSVVELEELGVEIVNNVRHR